MGREIRRVPPNWSHPTMDFCKHHPECKICYQPLHDQNYDDAAKEWMDGYAEFINNKEDGYYWDEWGMPPDREYCRSYKDEETTWYQVYENVSEGTPVTPPFSTQEELIDYLVKYGDFWAQKRKEGGISREAAEKFVYEGGYLPSGIVNNGKMAFGLQTAEMLKK